ncbi:MAG: hypothetical protein MJE77_02240 [Proteobacteria bacterium]|nr:hypothetical protein [Pseudomonadota bacterium]
MNDPITTLDKLLYVIGLRLLARAADKPIYFMFGDDTAFGPLKAVLGSPNFADRFFGDRVPVTAWSDRRSSARERLCQQG